MVLLLVATHGCAVSGQPGSLGGDGRCPAAAEPHLLGSWRIVCAAAVPLRACAGAEPLVRSIVNRCCRRCTVRRYRCGPVALVLRAWRRPGEQQVMRQPHQLPAEQRAYLATITWAPPVPRFPPLSARSAPEGHVGLSDVVLHRPVPDGRGGWPHHGGGLQTVLRRLAGHPGHRADCVTLQQTIGGRFLPRRCCAVPGPELAHVVEQRWRAVAGNVPLGVVAAMSGSPATSHLWGGAAVRVHRR